MEEINEVSDNDIVTEFSDKKVENLSPEERTAEYFQIKQTLKTLRGDLKDLKEEHPEYEDLKKLTEKAKKIRDKIKTNQDIHLINDKIEQLKDRSDLIKEIVKQQLLDGGLEEVKGEYKSLKLVKILKEVKNED